MTQVAPIQSSRQSQIDRLSKSDYRPLPSQTRTQLYFFFSFLPVALTTALMANLSSLPYPVRALVDMGTLALSATALTIFLALNAKIRRRDFAGHVASSLKFLDSHVGGAATNALASTSQGHLIANIDAWRWLLRYVAPEVVAAAMNKAVEQGTFSFGSFLYHQVTNQFDRSIVHVREADDLEDTLKILMALGDLSERNYRQMCTGRNYGTWHDELAKKRREQLAQAMSSVTVSV